MSKYLEGKRAHNAGNNTDMKYKLLIALSIVFLLYSCIQEQEDTDLITITKHIDDYLTQSASNGFSGSVLVAKKGEIILSKGYGWADRENKIPNSPSTVFNIGSVTKQFTASAILKLVEQGKIKTSDKISSYFDQAPIDKRDITIHQLLTHTSGISNRTGGFRYDEASKEQFLIEFFESALQSEPGTKYQYANANYILLTAILESVSNQTYGSFLQDYLFEPSQMKSRDIKASIFIQKDWHMGTTTTEPMSSG
ncbi:MAG: serine hydrolase domain-containing protein [Cyclobacteriaceae bacterium]